ncbi:hypothetical protein Sste5346_009304 [Sporothrix stenoceras]|uniref:Proteasome inhibitor PI31 subunit n=1 Tax=Sporothrix stenoceras TaxID=5173 RepID=A0ABR3YKN1_9PEZI
MTLKQQPEASGQPESSGSGSGSVNANPVSAERLQATMEAVLASPNVDGAAGAFVLFVHAFLVNVGFRLQHISQYSTLDGSRSETGTAVQDESSSSSSSVAPANSRLPPTWNINRGVTVRELIYSHPSHTDTIFTFRVHVIAPYVHIVGHSRPSSGSATTPPETLTPIPSDGISNGQRTATGTFYIPNYPPYDVTASNPGPAFRGDTQTNLSTNFQFYILQRLLPNLQVEGYTHIDNQPPARTNNGSEKQVVDPVVNDSAESRQCLCGALVPASRAEQRDPDDEPPTRLLQEGQTHQAPPLLPEPASSTPLGPVIDDFTPPAAAPRPGAANVPGPSADFPPPGFEDEHQMLRTTGPRGPGSGFNPSIGADDLNPPNLGPHDPLRPSLAGGGLRMPGGNGGVGGVGDGSFGGMHPTFDDPLFAGIRGQGGRGGNGFSPQNPPGARWDEPGPAGMDPAGIYDEFGAEGGMPQFPGGGRGRGGFGRGGGGFGGGFGGGGGGFGGFSGGSGGGFGGFGGGGFA